MPRQPEVHFRLKPKDKNGNCSIFLDFAYSGRRLFYSFGQSVKPGDWNKNKEIVKNKQTTTADGKFALNDLLSSLKKICEKGIIGITPDPKTLRDEMEAYINQNHAKTPIDPGSSSLFKLIDSFIKGEVKISVGKKRGRDKGTSCLNNYNTTYNRLKEFEAANKYPINFESITKEFFNLYVSFLQKTKKLAPNTISKDIATLKVFMNEAVDRDLTDNLQFKKKSFSFSEEETDHVYLTEHDLHKLYRFEFNNKKLEQVRDLFIFGAWTGLRFSDYSNIKPENIKQVDGDYFIDLTTQKTGERVIIPCNPVVLNIFEKYDHNANKLPKTISNQKFNAYIKDACRLAGLTDKNRLSTKPDVMLWEAVSSHTCRRSFATNYYLQGFPTIDLMRITGHRTESNFMKYLRVSKLDTAKRLAAHNKENWSKKILQVA